MLSKITASLLVLLTLFWSCEKQSKTMMVTSAPTLAGMTKDSLLLFVDSIKKQSSSFDLKKNPSYLIAMGYYHAKSAKYRLSKQLFSQAIKNVDENDWYAIGKIYNGLGNASFNLGDNPEALKLYSKALKYFIRIGNTKAQATIHSNLAQLFQLDNDNVQARAHVKTGLKLLSNQNHTTSYLLALHAMANVYGQSNLIDSALLLDKEGIAIASQMRLPEYLSMFFDNKANCFMYSRRPDSARFYFNKCLLIDMAAENTKQQSDTWLNLGVLATMERQPDSAEKYFKQSISLADQSGYRLGKMQALKSLAALYQTRKQFETALYTNLRYEALEDSIANDKKDAAITEWKAVFDTEQKQQEIKSGRDKLERKNLLIYSISSIALLALLSLYFAAKRRQIRKQKDFNELAFQQEQKAAEDVIKAEEAERRRIAAELHDGVGQTMTAAWLNLQAIGIGTGMNAEHEELLQTTTNLIRESCTEIRGISHNMMPDVLLLKGLVPAIKAFTANICQEQLSVLVSADNQNLQLNKMQELMLYRVIQECVQNTLKHAQATELDISINHESKDISLMIEDNGRGFDPENIKDKEGMGMNSVRSRVNYLKGTVEWNTSSQYGGTLVAIHIPISS
jgi:two-component system NarL family sensor kinase